MSRGIAYLEWHILLKGGDVVPVELVEMHFLILQSLLWGMGSLRDLCSNFLVFGMNSVPRCGVGKGAAQFMGGPERKGATAVRPLGVVAIGIGNFGAESQLPLTIKSENVPVRP